MPSLPNVQAQKGDADWLITMKALDWLSMFTKTKSVSDAMEIAKVHAKNGNNDDEKEDIVNHPKQIGDWINGCNFH